MFRLLAARAAAAGARSVARPPLPCLERLPAGAPIARRLSDFPPPPPPAAGDGAGDDAPSYAATPAPPLSEDPSDAPHAGGPSRGTVKWFDVKKGYGFVTPDGGDGDDVFVHHSVVHAAGFRSLGEGEAVEFEVLTEPDGRRRCARVTGPDGAYVQGAPRRMDDGYGGGGGGGYGGGGGDGGGGGRRLRRRGLLGRERPRRSDPSSVSLKKAHLEKAGARRGGRGARGTARRPPARTSFKLKPGRYT